ncbi:hypothetical protein KOR34_37430 [Posidoniimonas corsicana]|uniref:DUF3800 domain-containing protein n=1 Tax=Posidoniimonas corsicana TaxID=1938618 RepID=A0A5C5V7V2_9BACT|nr:DUF3800 domain-containing protein [Posidoniimonas corsicana]TWT33907.1 hypothetical protein KOR34_37430 [Posidoniimonas corsicana]
MTEAGQRSPVVRHYFVDEAGDPTLFNRKGRVIVGTPGCSSYFFVGKVDVVDPIALSGELEQLRESLLADDYFKGVPSMQVEKRKTALAFHAKDDVPEVRREVFRLLLGHDIRFYAVVHDKQVIARKVIAKNESNPEYRYHPNQLYDRCVSKLFKERLHKDDGYRICFAVRGSSDRTEAFSDALQAAKQAFRSKWGIESEASIEIIASEPRQTACLQVVDYFLWALQRFYERDEDRFLNLIWAQAGLVHDVDDTRERGYGVYYTQANPLTHEARAKK